MLIRTTGIGPLLYPKTQNYGGAIQSYIVHWSTTNLKYKYTSNKIVNRVITIFISVEFGTANIGQCQIPNFHFSRYLIGGGNVL